MNEQQDIITTLREQLSEARKTANELTDEKVRLERELTEAQLALKRFEDEYYTTEKIYRNDVLDLRSKLSARVRLDDPVVKGLVDALEGYTSWTDTESVDFIAAESALAAYNARVKEVGCE